MAIDFPTPALCVVGYHFERMSLLYGKRIAEPEVMNETMEVEAYTAAAAAEHLDRLDSACAAAIINMGARPNWWLDVGCGPGRIACKVHSLTSARIVGIDLAFNMVKKAKESTQAFGATSLYLVQADAAALPFKGGVFDLVYSNSLLHHLSHPVGFFEEAVRVMQNRGKFFLRDLVRPLRWKLRKHINFHGRNYLGSMRQLFEASVRAAYTIDETRRILRTTPLLDGYVSREDGSYLIIRR
ncbi:MAG: class I SAM-dependent methyltransferase [Acidobacteria bacterium]|nr:class I SAM-dependent methyltransferase [Acidobacteriota bacterium]